MNEMNNTNENQGENWSPKHDRVNPDAEYNSSQNNMNPDAEYNSNQDFQIPEANPAPKKKSLKKKIIIATSGLAAAALVTVAVFGINGNLFSKKNSSGTGTTTKTVSATAASASNDTSSVSEEDLFTNRDLKQTYDSSAAETISLKDNGSSSSSSAVTIEGNTVTITEAGIYVVSGTLSNGQIVVDCEDTDAKVQIVLDNATISNSSSACIYAKAADKVFVTTEDGSTNSLKVTGEFVQTDDNNVDGSIFSKCDLTVNGKGTLNINNEYGHGIVSKDDLRITGSTLNIDAAKKGLQGKDSVRIDGGTINITAGTEGIEGALVYVLSGDVNIDAADDGINASDGSGSDMGFGGGMGGFGGRGNFDGSMPGNTDRTSDTSADGSIQQLSDTMTDSTSSTDDADSTVGIYITGDTLNITADGDGIDSNGFLNVYGGTIYINGPTSGGDGALDYQTSATITGGTVVAAGSSGMAENFGSDSTQGTILYNFGGSVSGEVTLKDSDGNVIASYTPTKEYQSVVISSPEISNDGTYTISAGSESDEITMSGYVYGSGNGMGGGRMGGTRPDMNNSDNNSSDSSSYQMRDGRMGGRMRGGNFDGNSDDNMFGQPGQDNSNSIDSSSDSTDN